MGVGVGDLVEGFDLVGRVIGGVELVAAGGRIYFAKDSLARGTGIAAMYPELADWRAQATKADPDRRLITDMVRRLNLRNAP